MTELDQFLDSLQELMPLELSTSTLLDISGRLASSFQDGLRTSAAAMIPSHIYNLPSGNEKGTFLSVDLGGSTLRVALVKLSGLDDSKDAPQGKCMEILHMRSWGGAEIDQLKQLRGDDFFDWIAARIAEVIGTFGRSGGQALSMGLSWSFPIENTSIDSGKIQGMGKGFRVAEDLLGTDLKSHFTRAFARKNLNITLEAIVNDTIAALVSHAYSAPATRFSLIVGTGVNGAMSLPLSVFPDAKLSASHSNRSSDATEVLVNTELSMFGKGILPVTEWDDMLDAAMDRPGFQPFEYLVGGRYLGEIARLLALEGGVKKGLFRDRVPEPWRGQYCLPTELLAAIEQSNSNITSSTHERLHKLCFTSPEDAFSAIDAQALYRISTHISTRAATYCAIAIHALYSLRNATGTDNISSNSGNTVPIAFCGTVMEKYPNLQARTQQVLDRMTGWTPSNGKQRLELQFSYESAIFGAAVAVAAAGSTLPAPNSKIPERASNASTFVGSERTAAASPKIDDANDCDKHSIVVSKDLAKDNDTLEILPGKEQTSQPLKKRKRKSNPWSWMVNFFKRILGKFGGGK